MYLAILFWWWTVQKYLLPCAFTTVRIWFKYEIVHGAMINNWIIIHLRPICHLESPLFWTPCIIYKVPLIFLTCWWFSKSFISSGEGRASWENNLGLHESHVEIKSIEFNINNWNWMSGSFFHGSQRKARRRAVLDTHEIWCVSFLYAAKSGILMWEKKMTCVIDGCWSDELDCG